MTMKRPIRFFAPLLLTCFLAAGGAFPLYGEAHETEALRVVVVGDTGIGPRAYAPGFEAVQKAMQKEHADIILHLGDYAYQEKWFPDQCPEKYIHEIKETLAAPYPVRIFVAGDNDLEPHKWKPRASGCWDKISQLATSFDTPAPGAPVPRPREGTMQFDIALFAVLDVYGWEDPAPWLKAQVEAARKKGQWVIFALHEPALTTAWYLEKRQTVLKEINRLKPDLVFAGNQHSYERFFPIGVPAEDGNIPVLKQSVYARGLGVTHIVAGGGGALFKPFADLQGNRKRSAPKAVFDALAKRSLMFHYLVLDITHDRLKAEVYRICPAARPDEGGDPRWRPKNSMWDNVTLECEGKANGVTLFDAMEIRNRNGE